MKLQTLLLAALTVLPTFTAAYCDGGGQFAGGDCGGLPDGTTACGNHVIVSSSLRAVPFISSERIMDFVSQWIRNAAANKFIVGMS